MTCLQSEDSVASRAESWWSTNAWLCSEKRKSVSHKQKPCSDIHCKIRNFDYLSRSITRAAFASLNNSSINSVAGSLIRQLLLLRVRIKLTRDECWSPRIYNPRKIPTVRRVQLKYPAAVVCASLSALCRIILLSDDTVIQFLSALVMPMFLLWSIFTFEFISNFIKYECDVIISQCVLALGQKEYIRSKSWYFRLGSSLCLRWSFR